MKALLRHLLYAASLILTGMLCVVAVIYVIMLDRFPDLRLLDYGFAYHRDPVFPQDDITWFLLEKAG